VKPVEPPPPPPLGPVGPCGPVGPFSPIDPSPPLGNNGLENPIVYIYINVIKSKYLLIYTLKKFSEARAKLYYTPFLKT
jgi:hypothetical protein